MSSPCECRNYACCSNRDFGVMQAIGHHPLCPLVAARLPDDDTVVGYLLLQIENQRKEIERLSARCNRMVSSAAIDDVTWRPEK